MRGWLAVVALSLAALGVVATTPGNDKPSVDIASECWDETVCTPFVPFVVEVTP